MSVIKLEDLKKPVPSCDLQWRVGSAGMKNDGKVWCKLLAYVDSRAIMDMLDKVCGPENWKDEYRSGPNGGVICKLSIRLNGEWVGKEDGSDNTNIEAVKGGISGALKRAAVKWGIGRYLYNLKETWADVGDTKGHNLSGKFKDKKTNRDVYFKYRAPTLPSWALLPDEMANNKKQVDTPKPEEPKQNVYNSNNFFEELNICQSPAEIEKLLKSPNTAKWYKNLLPEQEKIVDDKVMARTKQVTTEALT